MQKLSIYREDRSMSEILLLIGIICLLVACMALLVDNKELRENPNRKEITYENDIIILWKHGKRIKGEK
jgi:hypothetical protein